MQDGARNAHLMAPFYPIFIRRSDGKLEIVQRRIHESNAPTTEQLDRTADAKGVSNYYREVNSDEVKYLDWRRKLGGMLARELIRDAPPGMPSLPALTHRTIGLTNYRQSLHPS